MLFISVTLGCREDLAARVFVSSDDLSDGVERLPIKLVHLNKCPILLPTKMLDDKTAARFGIDKTVCEQHFRMLLNMEVEYKLREVYKIQTFSAKTDPEQMLYDGFINDQDKQRMRELRQADEPELASTQFVFDDTRLNSMFLNYKARHFPSALNEHERAEWHELKRARLMGSEPGILSIAALRESIRSHTQRYDADATSGADSSTKEESKPALSILKQLEHYADEIEAGLV